MIEQAAFQEMSFDYAGTFGIELKHTVITYHYFWSLEYPVPSAVQNNSPNIGTALSAQTSVQRIREMMGNQYHWQHVAGTNTFDPGDDIFERRDGSGT